MNSNEEQASKLGQSIILSCIENNDLLYVAKLRINESDFITKSERDVWKKILKLDSKGERFDIDAVCNSTYVDEIDSVAMSKWEFQDDFHECSLGFFQDRVNDFVNLVDRNRVFNRLAELSKDVFNGKLRTSVEIAEKFASLTNETYEMHPVHDDKYLHEYINQDLKELAHGEKHGVHFGIKSIDSKLGKLIPGQMVIISARPAVGKSSIVLYAIDKFCREGKHVCLDTLEMKRGEMTLRMLAKMSNVMMDKIIGTVPPSNDELDRITSAVKDLKRMRLTVRDDGLKRISEIDAFLTMCEAKKNKVDMFVIDHFGLLQPDSLSKKGRYEDYTNISNQIKMLAKKHNCVMLVLSQLNRVAKEDQRPTLAELRDTGSLEQDADKVLAMWRTGTEEGDRTIGVATLKNRQGQIFDTTLKFYPSTMQFYETSAYV